LKVIVKQMSGAQYRDLQAHEDPTDVDRPLLVLPVYPFHFSQRKREVQGV
jgi:hypothetical protein